MSAPPELEALRGKLSRYLRESLEEVSVDDEGDFVVPYESVITWVRPVQWTEGRTLARVWSITNVDMKVEGGLTKFLLTANAGLVFGGFHLDEAVPAVMLVHSLLGEYLNRMELMTALAAVATKANEYAPEIKARFGGKLFTEQ